MYRDIVKFLAFPAIIFLIYLFTINASNVENENNAQGKIALDSANEDAEDYQEQNLTGEVISQRRNFLEGIQTPLLSIGNGWLILPFPSTFSF